MKKFIRRFYRKQGGFTLIELLVVIAILGILAAIIVPSVSKYIGSGQTAAEVTEESMVKNAVAAAMADAQVSKLPAEITLNKASAHDSLDVVGPKITGNIADYFSNDGDISALLGDYTIAVTGDVTYNGPYVAP